MMKKQLVTRKQALMLEELDFNDYVSNCIFIPGTRPYIYHRVNNHSRHIYVTLPTVDEAIDWLRRKFDIVIYDAAAPFVDPTSNKGILYSYKVKACNPKWGWNMRESLGQTKWSPNHYAMKRQAVAIALRWLIKKKRHDAGKQG